MLSYGLLARGAKNATTVPRGLCSPPSIALQQSTAASQGRFIFNFLEGRLGAKVDLFLSANRCPGHSWEEQVRDMYKPWLKQLSLDNCNGMLMRRCLLQRGLAMVLAVAAKDYDVVLFTRPDLVFTKWRWTRSRHGNGVGEHNPTAHPRLAVQVRNERLASVAVRA